MENIFENIAISNYPAIITTVCVPIIVGIVAIAFPILSGKRNRINTKYSSEDIARLFKKEWRYRMFYWSLLSSLIALFIYVLQLPHCDTGIDMLNLILDYSATGLVVLTTIFLVISLFELKNVIELYDSPIDLFKYYQGRYNKENKEKIEDTIRAVSYIFYSSITNEDEELAQKMIVFFAQTLGEQVKLNDKNEIEYPDILHEIVKNANARINKLERKPNSVFNDSLMLDFFIANGYNGYVSETTYYTIWGELSNALFYKNDDMVFSYWKYAHQYMSFQFSDYRDFNAEENKVNEGHKLKFKEFHYMLGALILYCKRYELLGKIMYFTQTMPATYKLVPNSMYELITEYLGIKSDWSEPMYYRKKYFFPDISGVDTNSILVMCLKEYFAILFFRQYDIDSNFKDYPYQLNQEDLPSLDDKKSKGELKYWKHEIEILKRYIDNYTTKDYNVLESLGFDNFLNEETYKQREQIEPSKLLEEYIEVINMHIPIVEKTQSIAPKALEKFKKSTLEILRKIIAKLQPLLGGEVEELNLPHSNYIGVTDAMIMDKSAWAADSNHLNYDEILAQKIARNIEYYFCMSFATLNKSRIYKISGIDVFEAVKKLDIKQVTDYIIASIDFHIEYYKFLQKYQNDFTQDDNQNNYFCGIRIVSVGYSGLPTINQSLFILRKSDLPELKKHDLSDDTKYKFELTPLCKAENIYSSVVDLYRNKNLRNSIKETYRGSDDLEKSVAVYIGLKYELRWRKGATCVQIMSQDEADSLDDVVPIE